MPAGKRDNSLQPGWDKDSRLFMIPNRPGPQELYRYFSPNYYPEHVEGFLHAAEDHWGIILTGGLSMKHQLAVETRIFRASLKEHIAAGGIDGIPKDWKFIGICQSASWLGLFHGFLLSLKAMLDVMGTVWARTAMPKPSIREFHKGMIAGTELAGGGLVKWFRGSCSNRFTAAGAAAETIERNSREWISEAVKYRDEVAHEGSIKGLVPLAVRMEVVIAGPAAHGGRFREEYSEDEIVTPRLPNGLSVPDYCRLTIERAERFLLDMSKLFAAKEARGTPGPPGPGDRMYISPKLLENDS